MGITTSEVHWTESNRGVPDEASVIAALAVFYDGRARYAKECFISSVWDERGKEKKIEQTFKPKTMK